MTAPTTRAPRRSTAGSDTARPTGLRLATLHLRTGMLTLARAELESMAGEGTLDDDALLDLGEVRWRTGDLAGAGDAAAAYLATGQESTLALVIAAEAQAALGRPAEARRLANRALDRADGPLDVLFAGMPRATLWPADGEGGEAGPVGTADEAVGGPVGASPSETAGGVAVSSTDPAAAGTAVTPSSTPASASAIAAVTHQPVALPDGQTQLDAARVALEAGDIETGAVRLALVLRVAPKLAPAVLEAAASAPGPSLDLVRGDAFRLLGREIAARRLFLGAIEALDGRAAASDRAVTSSEDAAISPDGRPSSRGPGPSVAPPARVTRPADGQVPLPFAVPSDGPDPSTTTEPEAS